MENPYRNAMSGIREKMALQSIRKIIRDGNINDTAKLNIIMSVVHDFEEDRQMAEDAKERWEDEEEEARYQTEQIQDTVDEIMAPLKNLSIRAGGAK